MPTPRRRAFTMVELLAVMSIIAILVGMLLPAVNVARGSARRSRCSNNIHQLGLALNNYHQTHKTFPPAMFILKDEDPTNTTQHQINWVICLLPFIDQTPVYKQFDFKKPINDQASYAARGANIPVLLCSSSLWGHAMGPNSTGADQILGCDDVYADTTAWAQDFRI